MRNFITNTALALVLALLAYLPFSVYRFENIKAVVGNEKVLSATTDAFGRYVSFGEKQKVVDYETAVFKVFSDKTVKYTDFYSITNSSNAKKEYKVEITNSDYTDGYDLYFTNTYTNIILVEPNSVVGLSINFQPSGVNNNTLSFIIIEKGL